MSGSNLIAEFPVVSNEAYLVRVEFLDNAGPARKTYLLAVAFAEGVQSVTVISQLIDYYGGNMPYPAFSMNSSNLIASADFSNTVGCNLTITQIGHSSAFSL
ncbi:hypothetical protein [Variovorax ginsengisoli]|uniref:Uncharacterized protein n=1 Tax=Variovorax ginsengisoli TaxID=363844 RepID=A0ABT9SCV8_9BURK|nr:hypothetical protein [Variovorax ginsengisoli]MDP9902196.1 hypothetical protein [Variovorax ginsengisoli]